MTLPRQMLALGCLIAVAACEPRAADVAEAPIPTVTEAWVSALDTLDNVDGPAFWFSPEGPRVIATAKQSDVLIVYDAITGATLQRVAGPGSADGQLERPNGLIVLGDSVLLVVERDNRRVQGFALPSFQSLGSFGQAELLNPYGIAVVSGADAWSVYVSDNYETPAEEIPPLAELGRRVKQYSVSLRSGRLEARLLRSFGDTTAQGAIRITESLHPDPARGILMVAEEDERDTMVKEYTLDGVFTGRSFGRGIITQQAEGIALWTCGDSLGYWIVADQGPVQNFFHLFDRISLAHLGSFRGAVTNTTDGVALTQRPVGPHAAGMFAAAHFDAGIATFGWAAVAQAVGQRADCDL